MRGTAVLIYVLWSLVLLGLGVHLIHKMTDRSNPNSFISNMDKLNETLNANP